MQPPRSISERSAPPRCSRPLVAAVMSMLAGTATQAGIVNVPADQPTIQLGIAAARNGDEVVLAPGTYFEWGIDLLGKAIELRSTNPNDPAIVAATIINAKGVDVALICNGAEGPDTIVNGLTIAGGAGVNGGGIIIDPPEGLESSPTVSNCRFMFNDAVRGGGIHFGASAGGSSLVTNCTFEGNDASLEGGAIFITGVNLTPTITGCTFDGNQTSDLGEEGRGGAIFSSGSAPQIVDCSFTSNASDDGGGIFSDAPFGVGAPSVSGSAFSGNHANYSGGAICSEGGDPQITGCTFDANIADAGGGGGICSSDGSPTVTDCTFTSNEANLGGGVSLIGPSATVTGCSFESNVADAFGGGGASINATADVTDCSFTGNSADDGGGGVRVDGGAVVFLRCAFIQNTSSNRGGGARVVDDGSSFQSCRFIGNDANRGGGLACTGGTPRQVTNCVFSGNSTSQSGGGGAIINSDSSQITVTNCTIVDNEANLGAGGIRTEDATTIVANSIVYFNAGNQLGNNPGGSTTVRHSDVEGGHPGANNVDVLPGFQDHWGADNVRGTDDDDLRLRSGNPSLVDTGDDAAVPAGVALDLGGDVRIADGDADGLAVVDMGAYERNRPPNDECLSAIPVADGSTAISNLGATSGGPSETCSDWPFEYDVWYTYEATSDGHAEIQLANGPSCCLKLAVYGAPCPTEPNTAIACDETSNPSLILPVTSGETYVIRIGTFDWGYFRSCDLIIASIVPCVGDFDGDGAVTFTDMVEILANWGDDSGSPADLDGNGTVGFTDLTLLLAHWGDC